MPNVWKQGWWLEEGVVGGGRGWRRAWLEEGVVGGGRGWRRAWLEEGVVGGGRGWRRAWLEEGVVGGGRGWRRAWLEEGVVGGGRGWRRRWLEEGVVGGGRGWRRAWLEEGVVGGGRGWSRAWLEQGVVGAGGKAWRRLSWCLTCNVEPGDQREPPESFGWEEADDWGDWVLDHGLAPLPSALGDGEAVPVAFWGSPQVSVVLFRSLCQREDGDSGWRR